MQNPSISWLSITLDGAFGTKTNVFKLNRTSATYSKKQANANNITISIHPNASSFVCRNVLDMLIFLGKCFPEQFIIETSPSSTNASTQTTTTPGKENEKESTGTPISSGGSSKSMPSFFSMLLRHDCIQTKKSKSSKHSKFCYFT